MLAHLTAADDVPLLVRPYAARLWLWDWLQRVARQVTLIAHAITDAARARTLIYSVYTHIACVERGGYGGITRLYLCQVS